MAEASEADCSAPSNEDNQANKKQKKSEKRRGPTTAQYVTKEDDGPYPLQWDEHGCAVGDFKNKYIAYTGALVRSKVKISIDKWGEVDNDIKEKLWTATKKLFMCDEEKREYVLKDCMTKWKNFKTRLTKEYFTKKTKNETSNPPWATYVGIEKEDWEIFKAKRLDKDFKALSDRNRANQQKNEHPHRLGRGGYMKRDEQHMKDQLKKAALSGSSGGVDGAHESETPVISPRPRYERWIDGRTDKKGEIPNPKTKVVANRIVELKEAQSSGEFVPDGSNDILTEALGTPEHGGYVRGLGGIDVEFDDEIFHYLNQEKFTTVVDGHDLKQLLDMEWISISCMKIWMRYLQKESKNCDADDIFGFFCPQKLRLFKNRPSALSSYLAHSMYEQRSKEYILAPFFHNHHWMLVVICFKQAKALLFNSLGGGPENVQLKGPLSVAYRSLNIHHGMRRMLSWTVIDCPRPAEGVDCGYYVMKYMQKIILIASLKDSNLQKYFSREPYSQDDMDDVRERWCRFLIDECL